MAGIEMVEYTREPNSFPPSLSPEVAKPDISLHQAAKDGNEDMVQLWMEVDKSGLDAYDSDGCTPFHYAAMNYHLNVMRTLVENGADPKLLAHTDKRRHYTALHLAVSSKHKPSDKEAIKKTIKFLVERIKFVVNDQSNVGRECPLHSACCSSNKAAVEILLDQENTQLHLVDRAGYSILHASCTTSNVEVLQLVLEKLRDRGQLSEMLTLKNDEEQTPLDMAFCKGHLRMASKLLEFASYGEYAGTEIDPHVVLDHSKGRESDAIVEFFKTNDQMRLSCQSNGATVLHLVVERGWARAAREIAVKEPSLLNEKDNHDRTPLHYAAEKNNFEIVELLMNQEGTDVDAADKDGCTPLLVAARQGCSEAFAKLLEKADLCMTGKNRKNSVLLAAEADHSAVLMAAKDKDPSIFRQVHSDGHTALHAAAASGSEKSAKVILDEFVNVNAPNEDQQTPLHMAAKNGHNSVVEMLLEHDCPSDAETDEQLATVNVSVADMWLDTPLHLAAQGGHCTVAITLLGKGACVSARNTGLETPLHHAALGGCQELVELLISKHHAEVGVRDKWQRTPLHNAAVKGHSDVVTTLLQHEADLTAVDREGKTALELAIQEGYDGVAMAIVKHDKWRDAMRHTCQRLRGAQNTTPMREFIKTMPEVAMEVLNKCKAHRQTEYMGDPHVDFYDQSIAYEFLEDLGEPDGINAKRRRGLRYYRPSYLFNRLVERCSKSERSLSRRRRAYTSWGPAVFDVATHPLMLMANYRRTELLNHPIVKTLSDYKWKRTWPLYIANVLFYLVFLIFFTAYVLVIPNPQSELCVAVLNNTFGSASDECGNGSNATYTSIQCGVCSYNPAFLYAAGAIVLLCVLIRVIMEFIQFLERLGYYFLNHENWLELFLYSFTLIFLGPLGGACVCPKSWEWQIGALAVFLAWIHLGIFVKKMPQLGLYVIMFEDIVITFIKIAIPALLLVLAFSMAFYMMFFVPSPLFAASPFATPGLSIIKAMTMAVGEMDFETVFRLTSGGVGSIDEVPMPIPYTRVSILLWIFFLIMMPILLMNLLTGLAVGDVDRILSDAKQGEMKLRLELMLTTDKALQAFRSVLVQNRTIALWPKRLEDKAAKLSSEQSGTELADLKTAMAEQMNEVKDELSSKMAGLRSDMRAEMGELRMPMAEQRAAMAELRQEQRAELAELGRRVEVLLQLCARGREEEGRDTAAGLQEKQDII